MRKESWLYEEDIGVFSLPIRSIPEGSMIDGAFTCGDGYVRFTMESRIGIIGDYGSHIIDKGIVSPR